MQTTATLYEIHFIHIQKQILLAQHSRIHTSDVE